MGRIGQRLMRARILHRAAGMTLLELVAACAILLVLATVAIPLTRVQVTERREKELRAHLLAIRGAIDRYKDLADKGQIQVQAGTEGYPPDIDTLVTGVDLSGGATGAIPGAPIATPQPTTTTANTGTATGNGTTPPARHIRFLRKEELVDPMTGTSDWGMRSVQDDPDATDWGGQDVFDVYSKSSGTALDGTKYSDW